MSAPSSSLIERIRRLVDQLRAIDLPDESEGFDPRFCETVRGLRGEWIRRIEAEVLGIDGKSPTRFKSSLPSAAALIARPDQRTERGPRPLRKSANIVAESVSRSTTKCPAVAPPKKDSRRRIEVEIAPRQGADFIPPWKIRAPDADVPSPSQTRTAYPCEWRVDLRWWNSPFLVVTTAIVVCALGWFAMESMTLGTTMSTLASELDRSQIDEEYVRSLCRRMSDTRIARRDARRDYLLARATVRLGDPKQESVRSTVQRQLRRAISQAPAVLWYRVSLASWSLPATNPHELEMARHMADAEPAALESLAQVLKRMGRHEDATELFRQSLSLDPARTSEVVGRLLEDRMPLEEALSIVPDDLDALAQLVKIAQPWNERALRKEVELKLTRIESRAPNRPNSGSADDPPVENPVVARLRAWLASSPAKPANVVPAMRAN